MTTIAKADKATKVLMRSVVEQFGKYVKLNKKISEDLLASVSDTKEPTKLVDKIAVHLNVKIAEKQKLLAQTNVATALESLFALMEGEISVLKVEKKIRGRVKRQMEKNPTRILSQRTNESHQDRTWW